MDLPAHSLRCEEAPFTGACRRSRRWTCLRARRGSLLYLPIPPHISYGLACEFGAEADARQRVQRIEELDGAALGRGDVGEMSGRCSGDVGEMSGRCSGDVGEMSGRYKGDAREMPVRCQ